MDIANNLIYKNKIVSYISWYTVFNVVKLQNGSVNRRQNIHIVLERRGVSAFEIWIAVLCGSCFLPLLIIPKRLSVLYLINETRLVRKETE